MTSREGFGTDADYLRDKQYKDATNLNARIALHARFARADEPWYPWLAARVDWPDGGEVLEVEWRTATPGAFRRRGAG